MSFGRIDHAGVRETPRVPGAHKPPELIMWLLGWIMIVATFVILFMLGVTLGTGCTRTRVILLPATRPFRIGTSDGQVTPAYPDGHGGWVTIPGQRVTPPIGWYVVPPPPGSGSGSAKGEQ